MGILEERIRNSERNMVFNFDTLDFKTIGYWLRTLKLKLKNSTIIKIKVTFDIDYMDSNFRDE